jgi:hypothetical protein
MSLRAADRLQFRWAIPSDTTPLPFQDSLEKLAIQLYSLLELFQPDTGVGKLIA